MDFVSPNTSPKSLKDSNASSKMKTTEEKIERCSLTRNISRVRGRGGRGACWSFEMGTRMNDKWVNYSHGPAQTKQQIGYCVVETFFVHKRAISIHEFTRLITAWTWWLPSYSILSD